MRDRVRALLFAGRPVAAAIAAVFTAATVFFHFHSFTSVMIEAPLAMWFLTMLGFVINDIFDVDKDRAGGVRRPIADGRLSLRGAWLLAGALCLLTVIASPSAPLPYAVVSGTIAGFFLYSPFARTWPAAKGLFTAVLCCAPLMYGAVITGVSIPVEGYVALVTFIVGRELYMDGREVEMDRAVGMRTIAVWVGSKPAERIGIALMMFGSVACTLVGKGPLGHGLGAIAALGIALIFLAAAVPETSRVRASLLPMFFAAISLATTAG